MIGKVVKISDYKLTYGKEAMNANIYGAFKSVKNGNKYVIYSYVDNVKKGNKVYYGSLFVRNNELVVMLSKDTNEDIIKKFLENVINDGNMDEYEIISLKDINGIQIIDDASVSFDVDINTLYDKTIPKVEVVKKEEVKTEKRFSISYIFFALFIIVLVLFFFVNPEVLVGEEIKYNCSKNYSHDDLNANVSEEVELIFTSKGKITSINVTTDYVFNDSDEYGDFRDKGYYYQYMEEGDTYKLDDDSYTYRVFSKIDTVNDYFMPTDKDELISYYNNNNYICKEEVVK